MNRRQAYLEWRRNHQGLYFGYCVLVGANIGWILTVLPASVYVPIVLALTVFFLVYIGRELRAARRFRSILLRVGSAIEEGDVDKLEAAYLDLAVLLPSANKRPRQTIHWPDQH